MSALVHSYPEPYKLPAGLLALAVHVAFFVLIYFGVSWRAEPPQGMVVEIWESLPKAEAEPVKAPP
ncbi:MAG: protein TolA, partial [Gallionellaceae bacterium]|nr:protein TolA [Gallionellaceae bacterium]